MLKLLKKLFKKEIPVNLAPSREEALRMEAIKDKETQEKFYEAKEKEMNKKKEELMKVHPEIPLYE